MSEREKEEERERERVCVCVCERERVCVCVCVCVRERERERERDRDMKVKNPEVSTLALRRTDILGKRQQYACLKVIVIYEPYKICALRRKTKNERKHLFMRCTNTTKY